MGYKREERVRLLMSEEWFDTLIESLLYAQKIAQEGIEQYPTEKCWMENLEKNKKLIDKLEKYGQYFNAEDGNAWMQAGLFRNEAEDLIWQLLFVVNVDETKKHYQNFRKKNAELYE